LYLQESIKISENLLKKSDVFVHANVYTKENNMTKINISFS